MYNAILHIAAAYTLLLTVTITSHIFINIFQTEHLWAIKFAMGLWEKYELSCDTKILKLKKKKKKSWWNRTGLL